VEGAALTPDSNSLDAFWERTEALLMRTVNDEDDMDMDTDNALSPAAAALSTAKVQAISAAGRLVAFQVLALALLSWGCTETLSYLTREYHSPCMETWREAELAAWSSWACAACLVRRPRFFVTGACWKGCGCAGSTRGDAPWLPQQCCR
jgi:hypothetical protein